MARGDDGRWCWGVRLIAIIGAEEMRLIARRPHQTITVRRWGTIVPFYLATQALIYYLQTDTLLQEGGWRLK